MKTANWPNYKSLTVPVPKQIDSQYDVFKQFYTHKHSSKRKIGICFSLGEAVVLMRHGENKTNELKVSTIGMLILLLFNDDEIAANGITLEQIMG